MLIISDTSALSALAETRLLETLPELVKSVTITEAVLCECRAEGAPPELGDWLATRPNWLIVVADPFPRLPETSALGEGEASSITLAWQHRQDCLLILDEKRGRKIARALGLRMTGVLALIVSAAKTGLLDFEEAVARLRSADFRIAESLIEEARQRARGS